MRFKYIRSIKQVTFLFGVGASIPIFAILEGELDKLDQSGWLDAMKTYTDWFLELSEEIHQP